MVRLSAYAEIGLVCSIFPVSGILTCWSLWHLLLWSFGGREEFRRQVIIEPQRQEWFMQNPKKVFWRDAPLSNLPVQIPEEIDKLSNLDNAMSDEEKTLGEHPHARNW